MSIGRLLMLTCALLSCACSPARSPLVPKWASPLGRDHPLAGRIWDGSRQAFVTEDALRETVLSAAFVAVGEQHDNADHHMIQARVIDALTSRGRKPGIVLEMLEPDEEVVLQRAIAAHPGDPDAVAVAVDWAHSGWPPWNLYRPIFQAASQSRLPLIPAGIDRKGAMRLAIGGPAAAPPDLVRDYGLDEPPSPAALASLRAEMRDVHCGLLPDSILDGMVFVQRVRDAALSAGLLRAGASRGGVLIAGTGHVRGDRGAPALVRQKTDARVVAVGLVEVRDGMTKPADYARAFGAGELPFDFAVFTPRASDEDHCDEIRRKHGARGAE
jgi:uncharacterized iron-regulated protein